MNCKPGDLAIYVGSLYSGMIFKVVAPFCDKIKVTYRAMLAARPSAPTAVEPDEPLDMMKVIHDGFALFKYAQGTKECIAFNRGVRYAEQARSRKGAAQ